MCLDLSQRPLLSKALSAPVSRSAVTFVIALVAARLLGVAPLRLSDEMSLALASVSVLVSVASAIASRYGVVSPGMHEGG